MWCTHACAFAAVQVTFTDGSGGALVGLPEPGHVAQAPLDLTRSPVVGLQVASDLGGRLTYLRVETRLDVLTVRGDD